MLTINDQRKLRFWLTVPNCDYCVVKYLNCLYNFLHIIMWKTRVQSGGEEDLPPAVVKPAAREPDADWSVFQTKSKSADDQVELLHGLLQILP